MEQLGAWLMQIDGMQRLVEAKTRAGELQSARQLVSKFEKSIGPSSNATEILINLLVRVGDIQQATRKLAKLSAAQQASIAPMIAAQCALSGGMSGAKTFISRYEAPDEQRRMWEAVALAYIRKNDLKHAQAAMKRLPRTGRSHVYIQLAQAQAKAGDIAGAKATMQFIDGAQYQSEALYWIVLAQIEAGQLTQAEESRRSITHPFYRATAGASISTVLVRAGKTDQAMQVAADTDASYSGYVYTAIAAACAEAGDLKAARSAWDAGHLTPSAWSALLKIAAAQKRVGDLVGYHQSIEDVIKSAAPIEDFPKSIPILQKVVETQIRVGDLGGATATAAGIKDQYVRDKTYLAVIGIQLTAGDVLGAKGTSSALTSLDGRCIAARMIAWRQAHNGNFAALSDWIEQLPCRELRANAYRGAAEACMDQPIVEQDIRYPKSGATTTEKRPTTEKGP